MVSDKNSPHPMGEQPTRAYYHTNQPQQTTNLLDCWPSRRQWNQ